MRFTNFRLRIGDLNKFRGPNYHLPLFSYINNLDYNLLNTTYYYATILGCHYNLSGLLKIEILILLRLARFRNLGTPPIFSQLRN